MLRRGGARRPAALSRIGPGGRPSLVSLGPAATDTRAGRSLTPRRCGWEGRHGQGSRSGLKSSSRDAAPEEVVLVQKHGFESYYVLGEGLLTEAGEGRPEARALASAAAAPPFRFSRMGPKGTGRQLGEPNRKKLGALMASGGGGTSQIPAGFTYLGQFLDHDLTFDKTNVMLGTNVNATQLLQARS